MSAAQSAAAAIRAARKKPPSAGRGRKKGETNHTTRDVRTMITLVAQKKAQELDDWFTKVGKRNPAKAIELFLRMIEFHIPKLSRQEIVKPPGGPPRILDSSQLTAQQREQLRLMLAQSDPALLEQKPADVLEPVGLGDAQVIDSVESDS